MPQPVKLIVVEGDTEHNGQEIPIRGSEYVIGRAASCDLAVEHSRVSMQHCRLVRQGERVSLVDMRSTYGTTVNGEAVSTRELKDGDIVRVGPLVLVIAIGEEATEARRRAYSSLARAKGGDDPEAGLGRGRDPNEDTLAVEAARRIFESISGGRGSRGDAEKERESGTDDPGADEGMPALLGGRRRSTLQFRREERGIAVMQLLDRSIIQDSDILQITHDLEALVNAGHSRLILDFGQVKHLSSQALGILLQCQKRCKAGGGLLKVCNPNPEVAEIFKIANLRRAVEIFADESQALESDWPDPPERPSPAAAAAAAKNAPASAPAKPTLSEALKRVGLAQFQVKLVLEVGKSKGKTVPINVPRFVIGRDQRCHLRPASEAISRVHTRIDQREGRVFVRDMGTTNGTLLGERLLQGEEAEARDGDRLQIGPLVFSMSIKAIAQPPPRGDAAEDVAASWLLEGPEPAPGDTALLPVTTSPSKAGEAAFGPRGVAADIRHLKSQVVGDALLVTILPAELVDEEQIGPVRHEMISLLDQPLPKRLVVRLDRVTVMSSLAVAMFLSHFQRLDRLGGGMRLCNVRDEVFPALENLLNTGAIPIYPSADQALRDPWPIV